jgi:hypothetical protein
MLLVLDQPGGEAVAEHVAPAPVLRVVALRIPAVQELHPRGELEAGALDDEVIVRPHQAQRVDVPVEAFHRPQEEGEEVEPVIVVAEQPDLGDGQAGGVVDPVRKQRARLARHLTRS